MDPLLVSLASFVAVTSSVMVGFGLAPSSERKVNHRLAALVSANPAAPIPRRQALELPFVQRVVAPGLRMLGSLGARLTPRAQIVRLGDRLKQAGVYDPQGLQALLALRVLGLLAAPLSWFALQAANPGLALVMGASVGILGISGPSMWLTKAIAQRQEAIVSALPDVLDLVTSCVEAGLSFDAALMRLTQRDADVGQELRQELARYLTDVRMGRTRPEALQELSRRCNVGDLDGLVAALVQADTLGVGIGLVLRTQSVHLRTRRRQRAQEAALKAPIKMLFPLVFFIFPAMFVVTLGPAVLRVIDTFSNVGP